MAEGFEKLVEQVQSEIKELRDTYDEELKKVKTEEEISAEFKSFEEKINGAIDEKLKQLEDIQNRIDEVEKKANRVPFNPDTKDGQEPTEQYKAFISFAKYGKNGMQPEEVKELSSGSDPEGGYLVPEEMRNKLIEKLNAAVGIRSRATVISTSSQSVGFPTFDYDGDASWTAENDQIGEESFSDLLGKQTFTPYKLARIFRVPQELAEDAVFDVEQFLLNHFARRFGEIEENVFINGDGVNKPFGLLNNPNMNTEKTGGTSVSSLSADNILNVVYAIRPVYRSNAAFMTHTDSLKATRKLKDGNGQYIWQPGLQSGQPQTLAGYPVLESEYFPQPTADGAAFLFGDMSYFWVVDRTDYSMQRLTEKYAEYDQIGYKLKKRVDAAPVLGEPFAVLNYSS